MKTFAFLIPCQIWTLLEKIYAKKLKRTKHQQMLGEHANIQKKNSFENIFFSYTMPNFERKQFKNEAKTNQKRSKNNPKTKLKRSKDEAKTKQKLSINEAKTKQKLSINEATKEQKRNKNGAKTKQKRSKNGAKTKQQQIKTINNSIRLRGVIHY